MKIKEIQKQKRKQQRVRFPSDESTRFSRQIQGQGQGHSQRTPNSQDLNRRELIDKRLMLGQRSLTVDTPRHRVRFHDVEKQKSLNAIEKVAIANTERSGVSNTFLTCPAVG